MIPAVLTQPTRSWFAILDLRSRALLLGLTVVLVALAPACRAQAAPALRAAAVRQVFTLTIDVSGGYGWVGIDGVYFPTSGSPSWVGSFYAGHTVTLDIIAASEDVFTGWSGALAGGADPATLTMNADKVVTANLAPAPPPSHTVTVTAAPPIGGYAEGWATSGETESAGAWALAAPGWRFSNWSGDVTGMSSYLHVDPLQSNLTAVAHFVPVAQTAVFYRQTFEDDVQVKYSDWKYTGDWTVIPDVTAKPGVPTDPSPDGPAGLVHNPNGDYPPNVDNTVTTTAIDCSGHTGITLTFLRSLTVEDANFDQATVEVSNDGKTWQTVYENPTDYDPQWGADENLTDPSWYQVSYDISAVADGQKTVCLRFGLKTNGDNTNGGRRAIPNLHGWAIDDITLSGAGPDPAYTSTPSGTSLPAGLTAYGPLPALPNSLWQSGPAVAGGGQLRYNDPGDPSQGTQLVGEDPGTNAAGVAGGAILGAVLAPAGTTPTWADPGTRVGGNQDLFNYPAGMTAPQYLQWGPLDLTGLQQTAVGFSRWLEVGAGNLDRASVQVHVATPHPADGSTDPLAPEMIAEDTTPITLKASTPKSVFPASTSEHYDPLAISFTYNTQGLAADGSEMLSFQYALDSTAATPVWVTFAGGTVTTNTYDTTKDDNGAQILSFGASAFASQGDYISAQDDAAFAVRAILTKSDGTALSASSTAGATISEVKATGVLWSYVWDNRQASPTTEILDTQWTPVSYDLSQYGADNCPAVWVRWSLGPTDSGFYTEYGGWSLDDLQILSASNRWSATGVTAPQALAWGQTGQVSITTKNAGTATWDQSYRLYEVQGEENLLGANPGDQRSFLLTTNVSDDPGDALSRPILRWGAARLPVPQAVPPGASATFTASIIAPPLTWPLAAPPNPRYGYSLALPNCDWAPATTTAHAKADFLPTLANTDIAHATIVTSRFPDDALNPDGSLFWARYEIEELTGRVPAVVQGYPDGKYHPELPVTRDQMAVFIARAHGLTPTGVATEDFIDVPTNYWAYPEIEACAQAGIVSGYPDHSYQPAAVVTRDQMAKFVALAADYVIVPAPTWDDAPGWFHDVEVELPAGWQPGDPDPRNPFRDYIATLQAWQVVYGYQDQTADGTHVLDYRPGESVTRDQLAVYIWRAFMQRPGSVVVLGGPAITSVPLTTGAAPYYGYANAGIPFTDGPFAGGTGTYDSFLVNGADAVFAYVTLDATQFWPAAGPLTVTFALAPVTDPSAVAASHTETIAADTLTGWAVSVRNDLRYHLPYRNVAWAIPTGLQGDYRLVVTINGNTLSRQPFISMQAPLYPADTFDDADWLTSHGWQTSGQPAMPGPLIYPLSYTLDEVPVSEREQNAGVLYNGEGSLELSETQSVVKAFSTAGHHNLRLALRFAAPAASFGNSDTVTIAWSPDYATLGSSAQWNTVTTLKRADIPTALQKDLVVYDLPNGDPNADPVIIGADDNENFAIRLSLDGAASTKVYCDDLVLEGT